MKNYPNKILSDWRQLVPATLGLLTSGEKLRAAGIIFFLFLTSTLDSIALLGIMPLVGIIVEPDLLEANEKIVWLHRKLGSPGLAHFINILALGAIMLIFSGKFSQVISQHYVRLYVVRCQNRLAKQLMAKVLFAPYEWHLRKNSAVSAHHISTDVLMWANDGLLRILNSAGHAFLIILSMGILVVFSPLPGIVGICIVGIISFLLLKIINKPLLRLTDKRRLSGAKYTSFANQIFAGIKDIKLSGKENYFKQEYIHSFGQYGKSGAFLRLIQGLPPILLIVIGQSALVIVVIMLWHDGGSSGEISAQMALLVLVISKVVPGANRFISEVSGMQAAIPSVQAIIDQMNIPSGNSLTEKSEVRKISITDWQTINLNNVFYKYDGAKENSLSGINIVIKRGEFYGIAGESGAGKSTLIDLISGLIQPTEGNIYINNDKTSKINTESFRGKIGYVPQTPYIIDATLRENVAFGIQKEQIDDAKVRKVLKSVNLKTYLANRDGNLSIKLGDKGKLLSGGERQRIAIARALYFDPEILILDEVSSALDRENERTIQKLIESMKGKITVIIIAHNLSTLIKCDSIFLLESGGLNDKGSYHKLKRNNILFKNLAPENS